jgi:hypothetical protein
MVKTRSCDVSQDLEAAMPVRDSLKEEIIEVRSFFVSKHSMLLLNLFGLQAYVCEHKDRHTKVNLKTVYFAGCVVTGC